MFKKLFSYFSEDIAVDLGTAYSLVYVKGRGIVINEPSVVAVNKKTKQILAVGRGAKEMVGRTPLHIHAIQPLERGVISDFEVTEQMLKHFISQVHKKQVLPFSWPRMIVGIPSGTTEVERKSVEDAAKSAGAREVYLIEEPMAAAIGARLPIQEAKGTFLIDIGGGTTEVAVISLGGIVFAKSLKTASNTFDQDIISYVEDQFKLLIGSRSAEQIKISIGSAMPLSKEKTASLRGRNLMSGLPEEITLSSANIREAIEKSVNQIVNAVKFAVEQTPPELLSDVMTDGIFLGGGGALLTGLDRRIAKATHMPVHVIEDPLTVVVRGGGMVLENLDQLHEVLSKTEIGEPPK